jgi:uncharacterized membrane protein
MKNFNTKKLSLTALFIALVCISTMVFQIPIPATSGYIHLGDSAIMLISCFFGWPFGMIAGGLGSGLADVLSGYAQWAPFTLIIKALMGFAIGKIAHIDDTHSIFNIRNIIANCVGIVIMLVGYFLAGAVLEGSFLVSATSIPSNMIQGFGGLLIYFIVGFAFYKAKIHNIIRQKI